MAANRGVVYSESKGVEVRDFDYPNLEIPGLDGKLDHAVIIKVIASNICGGDVNLVRGRKRPLDPAEHRLGHEVTGEVLDVGRDVQGIKTGDIVSVPFIVACGRCHKCKEGYIHHCEWMGPGRIDPIYGYSLLAGQSEYISVPYADFNLLKYPHRDEALDKILDLAMLSDTFPTGYHGAHMSGMSPGSRVYIAGAGPIGLACATSCLLLGAAVVFVGDVNQSRLAMAESFGCVPIDLNVTRDLRDAVWQTTRTVRQIDAAIDCVGFVARGHGVDGLWGMAHGSFLDSLIDVVRPGGRVVLLGEYVGEDLGATDRDTSQGRFSVNLAEVWKRSQIITTGRCPVMRYQSALMRLLQHDRVPIAKHLNATVISLDQAPAAYSALSCGAAAKYVIDPHGLINADPQPNLDFAPTAAQSGHRDTLSTPTGSGSFEGPS